MLCFIAATICLFPDVAKLGNKQMWLCKSSGRHGGHPTNPVSVFNRLSFNKFPVLMRMQNGRQAFLKL